MVLHDPGWGCQPGGTTRAHLWWMSIPPGMYNGSAKGIRVSGRLPKSCTLSCASTSAMSPCGPSELEMPMSWTRTVSLNCADPCACREELEVLQHSAPPGFSRPCAPWSDHRTLNEGIQYLSEVGELPDLCSPVGCPPPLALNTQSPQSSRMQRPWTESSPKQTGK